MARSKFKGAKQWQKWNKKATERTPQEVMTNMGKVGSQMMFYSQQIVPVDTGLLRSSLDVHYLAMEGDKVRMDIGSQGVYYAGYVEFGTVKMPPRSYVIKAYEAFQHEFITQVRASLNRGLR